MESENKLLQDYLALKGDLDILYNYPTSSSVQVRDTIEQNLRDRYYMHYDDGTVESNFADIFKRVARVIASSTLNNYVSDEAEFDKLSDTDASTLLQMCNFLETVFYNMMANFFFMPDSVIMFNAGIKQPPSLLQKNTNEMGLKDYFILATQTSPMQQLAACFTLGTPNDSIAGLNKLVNEITSVTKVDGGCGFNVSEFRPKHTRVKSNNRKASGPVSFLKLANTAAEVIQYSRKRGALMGILDLTHPDIEEFIRAKDTEGELEYFNLSVGINISPNEIRKLYDEDGELSLFHKEIKDINTTKFKKVLSTLAKQAYKNGEPGIINLYNANARAVYKDDLKINACNPCSEKPMPDYTSCNLGSLNLYRLKESGKFIKLLQATTKAGVLFLDNCINSTNAPLKKIEDTNKEIRPIGLGIMGVTDFAISSRIKYEDIPYNKEFWNIMSNMVISGYEFSARLGEMFGNAPFFDKVDNINPSLDINFIKQKEKEIFKPNNHNEIDTIEKLITSPRRNTEIFSIAPTGSIAILSDVSHSIEPLIKRAYKRKISSEDGGYKEITIYSKVIQDELDKGATEKELEPYLQTSNDISHDIHLNVLEFFQMFTCAGVSKTINMATDVTIEDIEKVFIRALTSPIIKGVTVYRNNSRKLQIINETDDDEPKSANDNTLILHIGQDNKLKPRKIKDFLPAITHEYKDSNGNSVHLVVSFDGKDPIETYILDKDNYYCALGKVISTALRSGTSWNEIIKHLSESFMADEILLGDELNNIVEDYVKKLGTDNGNKCPNCGTEMVKKDGQIVCINCGYGICESCS